MQIERVPRYQVTAPSAKLKHAFAVDTPADGIPLHQLGLVVGKKGGGKGFALFSLLRQLRKEGVADRIFVLSPTCQSNKELYMSAGVKEHDLVDDATNASLNRVVAEVEREAWDYKEHQKAIKDHQELQKLLTRFHVDISNIDPDLLFRAYSGNWMEAPPEYKHDADRPASRKGKPPVLHIVLDDVQGTELMAGSYKAPLHNLALRHRHVGGGLGCSLWLVAQTLKAQAAGLPRSIRENASLVAIFKLKDQKMVESLLEMYSADVPQEQLLKAYEYATNRPFGFLCIDFGAPEKNRLRAGWDEILRFGDGRL